MKHFIIHAILLVVLGQPLFSQTKKVCITIDDLPVVSYGVEDHVYLKEVITKLVHTADKNHVPIIGYVVEGTLYTNGHLDSFKVGLLRYWLQHGYDLGNHTYSHLDYNTNTLKTYAEEIVKGGEVTQILAKQYNKQLMYFRHPYLHAGATKALSDSLDIVLDSLGYVAAPVTIDNSDYIFANAYHQAYMQEDRKKMKDIGTSYILYMEQKLLHFEKVSDELFKRYIDQTLLIHANLLNAHYFDALVAMYKKHGYTFISQQEVLKDASYTHQIFWYSKQGNSWLYRWASKEKSIELMQGDPEVPAVILE